MWSADENAEVARPSVVRTWNGAYLEKFDCEYNRHAMGHNRTWHHLAAWTKVTAGPPQDRGREATAARFVCQPPGLSFMM
jgi:hypothetical protein